MSDSRSPAEPRSPVVDDEVRFRLRKRVERAFLAHLLAYPVAFLAACASIPLAIHWFIRDLDAMGDDLPAVGNHVVRLVAWPAGALFATAHLLVIPWLFGRDRARGRRLFWKGYGLLAAATALFGIGSWVWLWAR